MNYKYLLVVFMIAFVVGRSQSHATDAEGEYIDVKDSKMASASPNAYTKGTVSLQCTSTGSRNYTTVSSGAIQQNSIVLTTFYKRGASLIYIDNQKAGIGFDIVCVDATCCGNQVTWMLAAF
jgi:hypothetical protein